MIGMNKRDFAFIGAAAAVYLLLVNFVAMNALLIALNGVFVGALVGLIVAFSQLTFAVFNGDVEERDVARFTRAFIVLVAGICCAVWACLGPGTLPVDCQLYDDDLCAGRRPGFLSRSRPQGPDLVHWARPVDGHGHDMGASV